ncbi:MAG TPA: ATP-binding protein [Rhodanobacteraceae bacterium]|nr:ATP-binding protein [Rhodanobacteraceae bacterium]
MQLRLWQRLFIAFAALSVLALAGLAAWQQQSFRRGFLGYLDDVALDRLQPASARLASAYAEHGNWDFLRDRPDRFGELVEDHRDRPREVFRDDHAPPPRGEPPPPPRDDDRPPPGERGRPHPPHGPPDLMPRLVLVDASGAHIVGRPDVPRDAPSVAIESQGRTIGALRLAPLPEISDATDVAFARAQLRNVLLAGLVVLVLALALAFALARWLLEPVHALAAGTRALAAGDYAKRIDIARSDELGRLAGDFNDLAATLEQHRDARRRWGADIAHELRTPLSVLRGEIQALQDGVRAPTPAALDSLNAECERLGGLIEDLYQLSLADAGALEYRFERVDLGEIVHDALDLQQRACADAGLALEGDTEPLPIRGDARRLAQLVANLLANARRYTDAPGRIRVEAKATREGARLVVEDTPPGVPVDALPRLFDRLYRVEASRSRAAGGAGLGLAICRAIVEAHGGRIEASPSPLGGLRVVVELPRGEA